MGENKAIIAAGAVIYKKENNETLFALIHRSHYDDWSFPKGKVEKGEEIKNAAIREIFEETNLEVELEEGLPKQEYVVNETQKVVHYWLGRVKTDKGFSKNSEVDELRWLNRKDALNLLTYPLDRLLLSEVNK